MSLVSRLCSFTIANGRRYNVHPLKHSRPATAWTISSVAMDSTSTSPFSQQHPSPTKLRQTILQPTKIRTRTFDMIGLQEFSSNAGYDNTNRDAGGDISARSRFKEIPVHPSILEYIKRVGIGRQGKESRRKRHPFGKKKKLKKSKSGGGDYNNYGDDERHTMSREEERLFLGNGRVARRSGAANSPGGGRQHQQRHGRSSLSISPPAPPPPFGDGQQQQQQQVRRRPTGGENERDSNPGDMVGTTTQRKFRNIRVLPVKVLGRVTSDSSSFGNNNDNSDVFPRPTSGLPEVAIVGRSNVGKSTLLNALLYSGRSIEREESEFDIRRRNKRLRSKTVTSQMAKLPKGIKAKTSSKPGETRSIDFYQLSAEIEEYGSNEDDERENTNPSSFSSSNEHSDDAAKRKRKKKSSLLLVDLPGYGFAFGPKKERRKPKTDESHSNDDGESSIDFLFPWQSLIETYITNRPRWALKRVLLLIDARHGMKQADSHFLAALQRALIQRQKIAKETTAVEERQQQRRVPTELPPLQIVLTKCDLVSQVDLARRVVQVRQQLSDCLVRQPKILPEMLVSAQIEGQGGVLELQKELAALCSGDFQ